MERIFKGQGLTVYHQNFPKKQLKTHHHDEAHLFIPLEGEVEIIVREQKFKLVAGKMMFVPGAINHSFAADSANGERIVIQFSEELNKKFSKLGKEAVIVPTHPLIRDLCLQLFAYAETPFIQSLSNLILEILIDNIQIQSKGIKNILFATQEKILASQDEGFRRIVETMESDLELSMEDLATKSGVSKRNLSRIIQQEVGIGPKELYTFFRIQHACELIYQNKLGLTAIAFECGYGSLSQFIENFKRLTGQRPSEFRPSH